MTEFSCADLVITYDEFAQLCWPEFKNIII